MEKIKTEQYRAKSGFRQWVADFKMLIKFRLTMTVVFSALMAYVVAGMGHVNWVGLMVLGVGGFLVTGAANALNQVLEKDYDKLMTRTANRPLAAGRMNISTGVMTAGIMSLFGVVLLACFNPWAAFLGMVSLVSYAFLYTPLKRVTPLSVFVGAIPGALPMMIGCVAAQGEITVLALALFGLQFFWQFPHFWSIAWLGHEDYEKAGYKLLPGGELGPGIGLQSMIFALLILPVLGMLFINGNTSLFGGISLAVITIGFAYRGWSLHRDCNRKAARNLMFSSLIYLPLVLTILVADQFLLL